MSEEIIKVLNYIGEQLGIAIDWTSENVWPQVLDIFGRYRILQLISWSMWCFVSVCAMLILAVLWTKAIKAYVTCRKECKSNFWWSHRSYGISMEGSFGLLMFTLFGGAFALVLFATSLDSVLRWAIVPEIKYLELLKGYIS